MPKCMNCVGPSRTKESCAEDGRGSGPGPPARTPATSSAAAAKESADATLRGRGEEEKEAICRSHTRRKLQKANGTAYPWTAGV